ncbi:MAG: transcription-repair coupling factor [Deltaproteobacteria bacterium]|nr:transcription-repair coupling factor [Deltaproteobacteria bacterium]
MSLTRPPVPSLFKKVAGGISSLQPGQRFVLSGLTGSSKAYFLAAALRSIKKPILAVLPDEEGAEGFASDLRFFLSGEVFFYPSTELLPFEPQSPHPEISAKRIEFLHNLVCEEKPFIAVSAATNLLGRVMPREVLRKKTLKLEIGGEYDRDGLLTAIQGMGYKRAGMVEERGETSVRGHILDIFPPVERYPVRIEFFGDGVESIRTFDPVTQRSQKELTEVRLLPAKEADFSAEARGFARDRFLERVDELARTREEWEPFYTSLRESAETQEFPGLLPFFYEKLDTVFDYIGDAIVAVVDPALTSVAVERFSREAAERSSDKPYLVRPEELYLGKDSFDSALLSHPLILIEPLKSAGVEIKTHSNLDIKQDIALKKELSPLKQRLREWRDRGFSVYLTAHNKGQAERMQELFEGFSIAAIKGFEITEDGVKPCIKIAEGVLSSGFSVPEELIAVVTEEEIFGERVKRRAPPSRKLDTFLSEMKDLSEGDFIVHALHGIGLYRGLFSLSTDGITNDFILIEYRDGDKLYLPVGRMDIVSKYHGVEGSAPELDKLGGSGWEKRKGRVKKAAERIAGELLKLYAERKVARGHTYSPPGKLFTEFEAGFEYDATPDQERAIEEVMKDMGSEKPMDRLICGDVGYGKTEVAMRAAFRATLDNKQASLLVPTTVLAQQHFLTFKKRFAPFPVEVDVLSRFRSKKDEKGVLERLRSGAIDIIIGTHRLLQKDVEFKDLGLIIIDEEHRFGVRDKEKLKELKKEADVLTLTATPIPRTLHMALADVRDLSIINTPPEDRLSIVTRVIRFDDETIKEAIERELRRGGQVFFVHNRVESIAEIRGRLMRLTSGIKPGVRIAVAHGQMREGELEKVMLSFVNRECDVLLSTTIIESGLDIPSANTIIINRADLFGLAELYQLRGRVGRSSHRAYAYLISPDEAALTPEAQKRIEVVRELSDLGSGFRIAAYDLEIRGAGEVLGETQSGHIAAVGFDMYAQLLEEAVKEIKGEKIEHEAPCEVNLKLSVYIPEGYVPDTRERLTFYKRLSSVGTSEGLDLLMEELIDRYGGLPEVCKDLFAVTGLKLSLKPLGVTELSHKGLRLYATFSKKAEGVPPDTAGRIHRLIKKEPKRFRLTPDEKLVYSMGEGEDPLKAARYMLQELGNGC